MATSSQKPTSAALMTRRAPTLEFDVTVRSDGYVDESEYNEPSVALRRLSSPRSVIHPLGSDAECCPSLMMPGEDEELQQHASKGTLKAKPSEFDAPVASKEEKARCLRLGVEHMRASTAKERGVAGLATGIDVHATMWSGWRRLMTDHMSMTWMRSMQRIGESVAAVFEREKTAGLSTGDDPVPTCSDEDIHATDLY